MSTTYDYVYEYDVTDSNRNHRAPGGYSQKNPTQQQSTYHPPAASTFGRSNNMDPLVNLQHDRIWTKLYDPASVDKANTETEAQVCSAFSFSTGLWFSRLPSENISRVICRDNEQKQIYTHRFHVTMWKVDVWRKEREVPSRRWNHTHIRTLFVLFQLIVTRRCCCCCCCILLLQFDFDIYKTRGAMIWSRKMGKTKEEKSFLSKSRLQQIFNERKREREEGGERKTSNYVNARIPFSSPFFIARLLRLSHSHQSQTCLKRKKRKEIEYSEVCWNKKRDEMKVKRLVVISLIRYSSTSRHQRRPPPCFSPRIRECHSTM